MPVLPAELLEFLAKYIDSIAQLEALLLLRENSGVAWQPQDLAKRLFISEGEAVDVLALLAAQNLVGVQDNAYRYAPASSELDRLTTQLADYYRRYLIPITNIVHAKPRRIRQFADAFRLKRE